MFAPRHDLLIDYQLGPRLIKLHSGEAEKSTGVVPWGPHRLPKLWEFWRQRDWVGFLSHYLDLPGLFQLQETCRKIGPLTFSGFCSSLTTATHHVHKAPGTPRLPGGLEMPCLPLLTGLSPLFSAFLLAIPWSYNMQSS